MTDLQQLLDRRDIKSDILERTNDYTIGVAHEVGMWNCEEEKYDIALHYVLFDSNGSHFYDSYDLEIINEVKQELIK